MHVVAFREDALDVVPIHHEDGSEIALRHAGDAVVHRRRRLGAENVGIFIEVPFVRKTSLTRVSTGSSCASIVRIGELFGKWRVGGEPRAAMSVDCVLRRPCPTVMVVTLFYAFSRWVPRMIRSKCRHLHSNRHRGLFRC